MDRKQCKDILKMLKACYPTFKLQKLEGEDGKDTQECKWWISYLRDLEFNKAFIATQQLTKTLKFPPSIAEIREAYASLLLPDVVDAEQAWGMVTSAISKHGGIYSTEAAMNELPRQVQEAVKWVGGIRAISQAEKPDVLRGQFTKVMDAVNKRVAKELSLGPQLSNKIDNIRLENKMQEQMLKLSNSDDVKQLTCGPVTDDKLDYNIRKFGMLRESYARAQKGR